MMEGGISVLAPGYGLIDSFGSKGNLVVEIVPSWENMTFPLWIELLQVDTKYILSSCATCRHRILSQIMPISNL
jgi:hypothetical protein